MDEPSGALAGPIVEQIKDTIRKLVTDLGIGVLLVEQNVDFGVQTADIVHMVEAGQVVFTGSPKDLGDEASRKRLLGLV